MTDDWLRLRTMTFYAHHGVSADERRRGTTFEVEVDLALDLRPAGHSDDLADTVDYPEVFHLVQDIVVGQEFKLVEALAEGIAAQILARFAVQAVVARVRKLSPPIGGLLEAVEVEITRARPPMPSPPGSAEPEGREAAR